MDRRRMLQHGAQAGAAAACGGFAWATLLRQQAHAAWVQRPPGALVGPGSGDDFLARCIKCGQCVRACPYHAVRLLTSGEPSLAGTPWIVAREAPCVMCEPLWCVKACPSGALDPALSDVTRARMGLALIDAAHCLSWQGLRCEICHRVCPLQGRALTLQVQQRQTSRHAMFVPVVHADACTGCGLCEKSCPTEVAAIRIQDPARVQGRIGAHYRLDERSAAPAASAQPGTGAVDAATAIPAQPTSAPVPTPAPPARAQPAAPDAAGALDYLNRGGTP